MEWKKEWVRSIKGATGRKTLDTNWLFAPFVRINIQYCPTGASRNPSLLENPLRPFIWGVLPFVFSRCATPLTWLVRHWASTWFSLTFHIVCYSTSVHICVCMYFYAYLCLYVLQTCFCLFVCISMGVCLFFTTKAMSRLSNNNRKLFSWLMFAFNCLNKQRLLFHKLG